MGRAVFITGGGSGLGAALAVRLAGSGWRVGIAGRGRAGLAGVAGQVRAAGGEVDMFVLDVLDELRLTRAIEAFGADGLVCCAGVLGRGMLGELSGRAFAQTLAVNVQGVFHACRAAMLAWRAAGVPGDIVNIASLAGVRGQQRFVGFSAYAASKHAVIGLTEALSLEGRPDGIRVNAVAPGAMDTPMSRALGLAPATQPEAVVPTIVYLLDRSQSGPLTGSTIEVYCNDD